MNVFEFIVFLKNAMHLEFSEATKEMRNIVTGYEMICMS